MRLARLARSRPRCRAGSPACRARASRTRSSCWPSVSVTSTRPLRGAAAIDERRIGDELDALAHREHARIREPLARVAVLERDRAVQERDRDDVLQFTSGIALLSTIFAPSAGSRSDDVPHVVRVEPVLARADAETRQRRLNRIADRKRLDRRLLDIEPRAELRDDLLGRRLAASARRTRSCARVERVRDAGEAGLRSASRPSRRCARPCPRSRTPSRRAPRRAPSSTRPTLAARRTRSRSAFAARRSPRSMRRPPPRRTSSSSPSALGSLARTASGPSAIRNRQHEVVAEHDRARSGRHRTRAPARPSRARPARRRSRGALS